jgi:hypothetical protein
MRPKNNQPVNWKVLARCEECGVEPKAACRDDNDDVATTPCEGRAVLDRTKTGRLIINPDHAKAAKAARDHRALDDIARLLRTYRPDGLGRAQSLIANIQTLVTASGRGGAHEAIDEERSTTTATTRPVTSC